MKQQVELDKFLKSSTTRILRLYKKGEIDLSLIDLLSELELLVLQQLFSSYADNQTEAAKFIKTNRTTLLYRMDKYGRKKILKGRKK